MKKNNNQNTWIAKIPKLLTKKIIKRSITSDRDVLIKKIELASEGVGMQLRKLDENIKNLAESMESIKIQWNDCRKSVAIKEIKQSKIGEAWSGNTINTVIFRHHGLITKSNNQFAAFYLDEKTIKFVKRDLVNEKYTFYDYSGSFNLKDAHNSISLGVDEDGYIHVLYGSHANEINYIKSRKPYDINDWMEIKKLTGKYEEKFTYPAFIQGIQGVSLALLYRDGTHKAGTCRLKFFYGKSQKWQDKNTPLISGVEQKYWPCNPYWNHPVVGEDGQVFVSYVWRTQEIGKERYINNINMGCMWSPDNGHHWYTVEGSPLQLPVTPVNSSVIYPSPMMSNLINQCSMALDKYSRPHIAFYSNDENLVPQYKHLWHDGTKWLCSVVSNRKEPFELKGGGTLRLPMGRPEILVNKENVVLYVFRSDFTKNRMRVLFLYPPEYLMVESDWIDLSDDDLGFAEPIIDKSLWADEGILSMYLQHCEQPDHEGEPLISKATASILSVEFEKSSHA